MANIEETEPNTPRKKTRKRVRSEESALNVDPPLSRSDPTDRIASAKNEYIKALEKERRRLLKKVDQLQAMVDRLTPANARLEEAHANAVANNILATILVAIGGGAISFATFAEGASKAVAYLGVAILISGVLILIFATLRGRATKPAQPS
jgi:membrane-bound ClpP family serine protease